MTEHSQTHLAPAPPVRVSAARTGLLQRKCACGGPAGLTGNCEECAVKRLRGVQAKLEVGPAGDHFELEADRVADEVMSGATAGPGRSGASGLQRRTAAAAGPSPAGPAAAPPVVREALDAPGRPLEAGTRDFMESRFGHDFSRVRIHDDTRADASSRALDAAAYTVGRDIVFRAGRYEPGTAAGRRLIAHELTHVLQQGAAGLGPRLQRQPDEKAKTPEPEKAKTPERPVENCPFPSDFADASVAGAQMMCVSNSAFEKNASCNLTEQHFALINAAKTTGRRLMQKAKTRMYMVGGPERAQRIAARVFKGTPPDNAEIKSTLDNMVRLFEGDAIKFRGATCADPLCESEGQHAAAYESGPTEPVALCPRSFLPSYLPELSRTIIHEAAHLSGIDIDPDVVERYCPAYSCEEPCQDKTSADAWTVFLDCLGQPLPQQQQPQQQPQTTLKR
ncbi:MAG TPA: DUF4157 domain-containing protein [Pyrinomonadaceae bacterium]|nr:DUF4157 domain-containing protein [Pyrinomonadaceae bacterium]